MSVWHQEHIVCQNFSVSTIITTQQIYHLFNLFQWISYINKFDTKLFSLKDQQNNYEIKICSQRNRALPTVIIKNLTTRLLIINFGWLSSLNMNVIILNDFTVIVDPFRWFSAPLKTVRRKSWIKKKKTIKKQVKHASVQYWSCCRKVRHTAYIK